MTQALSRQTVLSLAPRGWRDWFQTLALAVLLTVFYLSGSSWIRMDARLMRYSFLIGLTAITVLLYLARPWPVVPRASARIIVAGASFIIVCFVGAVFSQERWDSFQRAGTFLLLIVFGIVWARVNAARRTGLCLYWGAAAFSVVCCVLGILGAEQSERTADRLTVLGTNANWAGGMFGLAVIVFLLGFLASRSKPWRVGLGIGCALAAVLLVRTGSRTSMLACLLALATTAVVVKKLRRKLAIIVSVGFLGTAVLWLFGEYFDRTMDAANNLLLRTDASGDITSGRLSSLKDASWDGFLRSPLVGAGLGGWGMEGAAGELGYVTLLGLTGVLGVLTLCTWMFLVWRKLWLAFREQAGALSPASVAVVTAMTLLAYFAFLNGGEGYVVGTGNAVTPLMWTIGAYASTLDTPSSLPSRVRR